MEDSFIINSFSDWPTSSLFFLLFFKCTEDHGFPDGTLSSLRRRKKRGNRKREGL